jgi:hypothetical protein
MEPIALKPASAAALRQTIRQIETLNAQLTGAVEALAVAHDVPPGWQFDVAAMAFVPPASAQGQGAGHE